MSRTALGENARELISRIFVKAAREMQERVTKYKETIAVSGAKGIRSKKFV